MHFKVKSLIKSALFLGLMTILLSRTSAAFEPFDTEVSTNPIGSSYYRHLAFDYDLDLKKLVQYEKKGFGRTEIITLILLSKMTGTPLKEYGNHRLKNKKTLKEFTEEAGFHYPTLYKTVKELKASIEAKGNTHLPPPVFHDPKDKKSRKNREKVKENNEFDTP